MKVGPTDILLAEARSLEARTRLSGTIGQLRQRLRPASLAQDAVDSATQGIASAIRRGAEGVRDRPLATAAFAGAIGLVAARGWIFDILRGVGRAKETLHPDGGLKPKRKKTAKKETGK